MKLHKGRILENRVMQRTPQFLPKAVGRWSLGALVLAVGVLRGCSTMLTGDNTKSRGDSSSQQPDRPDHMPMPLRFLANPAAYPGQRSDKSVYPPGVTSEIVDGGYPGYDVQPWRIERHNRGFLVRINESENNPLGGLLPGKSWRIQAARLALGRYAARHIWNDAVGSDIAAAVRTGDLPVEPFIRESTHLQSYNQSLIATATPWSLWWIDLNTGLFEAHVRFADELVADNMDRAIAHAETKLRLGFVSPYIDELRFQDRTQADAGVAGGADVTTPSGETATPADDQETAPSPETTQGGNDGEAVTLTTIGRGANREEAIQAALASAVREAGGARIQSEYRTRGNRLAEQDINMVSEGVVVDHEVVREKLRDGGGRIVFVNATVDTARAMHSIEEPSKPLWDVATTDWQQLSSYQTQQRRYREWLSERTDAETVLDKGYVFQTIGVKPTNIGAEQVRGELAIWIAPNPSFWQQYERALSVGSDLARPGNAITVGRAGPMPYQSTSSCSLGGCSRLGFPRAIRIPASAADARAPHIRALIRIPSAVRDASPRRDNNPYINLWQGLLRRPNQIGGFHPSGDHFFGRFGYTAGGQIHPVTPHVGRLNDISDTDNPDESVVEAMQVARELVPEGMALGPDNIYRRATGRGLNEKSLELAFDGGIVMTVEVVAPTVEQLRAIGDQAVEVTVDETRHPPTAMTMR